MNSRHSSTGLPRSIRNHPANHKHRPTVEGTSLIKKRTLGACTRDYQKGPKAAATRSVSDMVLKVRLMEEEATAKYLKHDRYKPQGKVGRDARALAACEHPYGGVGGVGKG